VLNLYAYDQIVAYVKMLITKLLTVRHGLLPHPPKHKKEDDKSSSIDLAMFDTEDDKSSSIDLAMFDTEDDKSSSVDFKIFDMENSNASDLDDCCHYIEKVSTSIQMFSTFITSLMITN
jgi:hypothetical protein